MTGALEPEYVLARRVLLDAFEALGDQRAAVVLVGAQAIYLHTGDADIAVAPYTTDGDVALDPSRLRDNPKLAEALSGAGFAADVQHVGTWIVSRPLGGRPVDVKIDLMVPEALGGPGRRGARLGPHGNKIARKARGLEATLVDRRQRTIEALDGADGRAFEVAVAGPAALMVAKLHKIAERIDKPGRSEDKDALDVLRLLRGISTEAMADGVHILLNADLRQRDRRGAHLPTRSVFRAVPIRIPDGGTSGSPAGARRHDRRVLRFLDAGPSPTDQTIMTNVRKREHARGADLTTGRRR